MILLDFGALYMGLWPDWEHLSSGFRDVLEAGSAFRRIYCRGIRGRECHAFWVRVPYYKPRVRRGCKTDCVNDVLRQENRRTDGDRHENDRQAAGRAWAPTT